MVWQHTFELGRLTVSPVAWWSFGDYFEVSARTYGGRWYLGLEAKLFWLFGSLEFYWDDEPTPAMARKKAKAKSKAKLKRGG